MFLLSHPIFFQLIFPLSHSVFFQVLFFSHSFFLQLIIPFHFLSVHFPISYVCFSSNSFSNFLFPLLFRFNFPFSLLIYLFSVSSLLCYSFLAAPCSLFSCWSIDARIVWLSFASSLTWYWNLSSASWILYVGGRNLISARFCCDSLWLAKNLIDLISFTLLFY